MVEQSGKTVCVGVQACPHDSVELRLRPPGIDLWTSHKPMAAELALQFTLLGAGSSFHFHTALRTADFVTLGIRCYE